MSAVEVPIPPAVPTRVPLAHPPDTRAAWHPTKPEFAYACNALSLGMPHGEPYVTASVRRVLDDLDDVDLVAEAHRYLAEEREHQRQHRRFNELLVAQHPALRPVEGGLRRSYRFLDRRLGRRFGVAFAAGFEAVAFASARWIDAHRHALFAGADPVPATLFLWHLAEEVEHKAVAFDVWRAVDGNRWRYAAAMAVSFLLLAVFILAGTVVQLAGSRRILSPVAWFRLVTWAFSYCFEVLPTMVVSALPGHHPDDLADPVWLTTWLHDADPAAVAGLTPPEPAPAGG